MGLYETQNFCASKQTIENMKRQATGWEKIFANHISDKGIISRYPLLQLSTKTNNPREKWAKNFV